MSPVAIHDDESDWSDSSDEEDARSDVETNVLLGIPDGEIKTQGDIDDAAVSRIGGRPVRYSVPYFYRVPVFTNCVIYLFTLLNTNPSSNEQITNQNNPRNGK